MAIPAIPQNVMISQGNGQIFLQWDLTAGASSYSIQRSLDNVNFSNQAAPSTTNYLDTTVVIGTEYWYRIASINGSGTSAYTSSVNAIPAPAGELSLAELRQRSQERADRVNSPFVAETEWNFFINQSLYELYDLLITTYEDYFIAPTASFRADGSTFLYPLPNGLNTFLDQSGNTFIPTALYKLRGVDLGLNSANNAYVTVNQFMFMDRNKFVYPNTASTIYGVFNLQYRLMGDKIEFIPTPSGGQTIRLWYIPRLPQLLKDMDITTIGFSGWLQYVIIRAAKYALDKEESDTSKLDAELLFLKARIEETASNRDAGQPQVISDVRQNGQWGSGNGGYGWSGPMGGF